MKAKLTILGSGTSSGIPMIGCNCPVCTSSDPRDKRLRASALAEYGGLTIMVDCGPDFRQQALRAGIVHLDAILLTHNHMDHVGGLDDTRALNLCESHPVNIYCEEYVEDSLRHMYAYAFAEPKYQGAPEWHMHRIDGSRPFKVFSNAGDEVLKTVANALKEHMLKCGFVARWGGEEFLLVFDHMDATNAGKSLNDLLEKIRKLRIPYNEEIICVTMTFGVINGDHSDISKLLKDADDKLYFGKEHGRNRVITD